MKKLWKTLFSRVMAVALAILIQVFWIAFLIGVLDNKYKFVSMFVSLFSVMAVLWIVNKRSNPSYKLVWTILILAAPVFGAVVYFLFGKTRLTREMKARFDRTYKYSGPYLKPNETVQKKLEVQNISLYNQSRYISESAGFPLYNRTETQYFPEGSNLFEVMLKELEQAEHFIYLEYFIINDGKMWSSILEILKRKAKAGVDVRLIYDDFGCVNTMPKTFRTQLEQEGIQCAVFNPFIPVVSSVLNNRDHRKITVIDGHTGFTGGINLADEYINKRNRFGHWKDSGIMLKGEAVWSFTVMFLQTWSVVNRTEMEIHKKDPYQFHKRNFENDGFVQPYGDTPLDDEIVGENIYLNIINKAQKYVYICTPYLIIDNEVMTALCLAAKSGVDVRIVTPGVPDKKLVFLITRSYYAQLIDAGVKIYEYSPGFIHSKLFVSDDTTATVGTVNLDYRSLYLHFECGVWMGGSKAVMQVKQDVCDTMDRCRRITSEFFESTSLFLRILQIILRLFAPLL